MFHAEERPIGLRRGLNPNQSEQNSPAPKYFSAQASVHPQEMSYFMACAIFSAVIYGACLLKSAAWLGVITLLLLTEIILGLTLGHIRGNSIRVSPQQFPEIHQMVQALSEQLGLEKAPAVYIAQRDNWLYDWALRALEREYIVLTADRVAAAEKQGGDALRFIIAHELAHLHCGHFKHRWLILPAQFLPGISHTYYRACEATCDTLAAHLVPQGAVSGILSASGVWLQDRIDAKTLAGQAHNKQGFWVWAADRVSSRSRLAKRLQQVMGPVHPKKPMPSDETPGWEDAPVRPRLKNGLKRYNVPPAIALRS